MQTFCSGLTWCLAKNIIILCEGVCNNSVLIIPYGGWSGLSNNRQCCEPLPESAVTLGCAACLHWPLCDNCGATLALQLLSPADRRWRSSGAQLDTAATALGVFGRRAAVAAAQTGLAGYGWQIGMPTPLEPQVPRDAWKSLGFTSDWEQEGGRELFRLVTGQTEHGNASALPKTDYTVGTKESTSSLTRLGSPTPWFRPWCVCVCVCVWVLTAALCFSR